MGAWSSFRVVAAYVGVLVCAAGSGSAAGQGAEASHRAAPATVSVSALQVPARAWQHFEKARQAAAAGNRREEYERELAKALELDPKFGEAYVLRAAQEVAGQRYEAGIEDALTAERLEPGIAWAGIVLASAYNGLQRYQDAFVVLDNLHGADIDTWQAKYEMARTQVGRGDREGALHWSALALAAVPADHIDVRLLRANALQMAYRWKEALAEMEAYVASDRPQAHRSQVLAAIESLKQRSLEEEAGDLASR